MTVNLVEYGLCHILKHGSFHLCNEVAVQKRMTNEFKKLVQKLERLCVIDCKPLETSSADGFKLLKWGIIICASIYYYFCYLISLLTSNPTFVNKIKMRWANSTRDLHKRTCMTCAQKMHNKQPVIIIMKYCILLFNARSSYYSSLLAGLFPAKICAFLYSSRKHKISRRFYLLSTVPLHKLFTLN